MDTAVKICPFELKKNPSIQRCCPHLFWEICVSSTQKWTLKKPEMRIHFFVFLRESASRRRELILCGRRNPRLEDIIFFFQNLISQMRKSPVVDRVRRPLYKTTRADQIQSRRHHAANEIALIWDDQYRHKAGF